MTPNTDNHAMSTITDTITRARAARCVTTETIRDLEDEKARLLKRGLVILMRADDYAARERWLVEYSSLCRRLNENRAEVLDVA